MIFQLHPYLSKHINSFETNQPQSYRELATFFTTYAVTSVSFMHFPATFYWYNYTHVFVASQFPNAVVDKAASI